MKEHNKESLALSLKFADAIRKQETREEGDAIRERVLEQRAGSLSLTLPPTREEDASRGKMRRTGREMKRYSFFSERIPFQPGGTGLTFEQSERLVAALNAENYLINGYLRDDPRKSQWRSLAEFKAVSAETGDPLTADASGISEVLNVAWAEHEITADQAWRAFKFLANQCSLCSA